ncbi:sugar transferase [Orenia marismortui]|uniref:Exopolysaccharide biosynthesis polyprenyl glycosylphosphotransferase n=1 Tax=Orenia marismortui TaxID=46469 RepID=A0A4R8HLK3_9FIRM|nr:sugar transferase [Orenia marismortui]TDX59244.1 exopolysaccharide biosynthesis polyprenyl glycosylphosphotransferase [Orenia marismortui]
MKIKPNSDKEEILHDKNLANISYPFFKRLFDIIFSLLGIMITIPIMISIAIAIKLDSSGSIIFKQTRLGKDAKRFSIYKFRSMIQGAEEKTGAIWAKENDCRVTKVGKFLRRTRLDELPQLFNILKGEMTLVGPRPERPILAQKFEDQYPGFEDRLVVKPGLTGLAQVKGGYNLSAGQKLRFDMIYIRERNLFLDLWIVFKTIVVMIKGEGAR